MLLFETLNPIPKTGYMEMNWSPNATFYKAGETECFISHMYAVTHNTACIVDFDTKILTFSQVFAEAYEGKIRIEISKIRLPLSNKNLVPF